VTAGKQLYTHVVIARYNACCRLDRWTHGRQGTKDALVLERPLAESGCMVAEYNDAAMRRATCEPLPSGHW
jgi:hypothetical protein